MRIKVQSRLFSKVKALKADEIAITQIPGSQDAHPLSYMPISYASSFFPKNFRTCSLAVSSEDSNEVGG